MLSATANARLISSVILSSWIMQRSVQSLKSGQAAIGRINDEQLLKLRTLGLTEEEAEEVIIQNFLN